MQVQALNGNWVDLVILLVVGFFVFNSLKFGFWIVLADFVSFLGSLVISLRSYQFTAQILKANFSLSRSITNAVGFLLTAVIIESILAFALGKLIRRLPERFFKEKYNRWLAPIPAVGEALVLVAFVLTMVVSFPVAPHVKSAVLSSKIGGKIVEQTSSFETTLGEIFGGVVEDSLTYLIVKPGETDPVNLTVESYVLTVDEVSERGLFDLLNQERGKEGRETLLWDQSLVPVARAHARDMWERKYFGHVSPDGADVGDRLEAAEIEFLLAGENLALAPNSKIAHNGLMSSEGHRANILEEGFGRGAIGVIDNGVYGKMFVQVFAD